MAGDPLELLALPLFLPLLPQLLLVWMAIRYFDQDAIRGQVGLLYFAVVSAFMLMLTLTAAFQSESELFLKYAKLVLNSGFAIIAASALVARYGANFPKVYTDAIVVLSVLGIAGLALTLVTDWRLAVNIGERLYLSNLLTVWISDSGFNSSQAMFGPFQYRLQSFFDEPGTYGMLLLPALYQALETRRWSQVLVLVAAVFLTESANAWLGAVLLFALFLFQAGSTAQKLGICAALGAMTLAFADVLLALYDIKMGIDAAYASNSSFGTRALEYAYVSEHFTRHALPLSELPRAQAALPGISSSYVSWAVHAGWAFLAVFLLSATVAGWVHVKIWFKMSSRNYFPFVLAVTLLSSGFQRTSIFDNILFMALFYWAVMYRRAPMEEK